jgi:hypothetical protein
MTPPHNKIPNQKKKECNFYLIKKKEIERTRGWMHQPLDRAVPVRSKQIKKEVELEIRPQKRSKTTREEGRERRGSKTRDRRRQLREAHESP